MDQPSQEARTGHQPEMAVTLRSPHRQALIPGFHAQPALLPPLPPDPVISFQERWKRHKLQREGRGDRHLDSAPPPTLVPSCTGLVCCESTFHLPASQAPPLLSQSKDEALLGVALDWGWCPRPEAMHWL